MSNSMETKISPKSDTSMVDVDVIENPRTNDRNESVRLNHDHPQHHYRQKQESQDPAPVNTIYQQSEGGMQHHDRSHRTTEQSTWTYQGPDQLPHISDLPFVQSTPIQRDLPSSAHGDVFLGSHFSIPVNYERKRHRSESYQPEDNQQEWNPFNRSENTETKKHRSESYQPKEDEQEDDQEESPSPSPDPGDTWSVGSDAAPEPSSSNADDDRVSAQSSEEECICFDLWEGNSAHETSAYHFRLQAVEKAQDVFPRQGPFTVTTHEYSYPESPDEDSLKVFRADLQVAYVGAPFTVLLAFSSWMPSERLACKSLRECLLRIAENADPVEIIQPTNLFPFRDDIGGICSACLGQYRARPPGLV